MYVESLNDYTQIISFDHIFVLWATLVILTDMQIQGKLKAMFLGGRGEVENGLLPTEWQQMIYVSIWYF